MGFIVLLAVGAVLGWTATIVTRSDDGRSILLNVAVGMIGALVGGALSSEASLLVGISLASLLTAIAGALVFVGALNFSRVRSMR